MLQWQMAEIRSYSIAFVVPGNIRSIVDLDDRPVMIVDIYQALVPSIPLVNPPGVTYHDP
jgi:hypothetical protein